MHYKAVRTKTI
ncbi:hypothetical protein GMOD_00010346 [Pyrenophora seminiperda CCB06]|uniref:Uncharacterized protein n=1 Tax=Pyrenophora seminiperda CCB06 TaxID=1302712 RepID=A0A3M7M5L5_9PLEO|nr:hypothetical protein GMOD_00010346 [Pyrenophora seminiperda CCB06]